MISDFIAYSATEEALSLLMDDDRDFCYSDDANSESEEELHEVDVIYDSKVGLEETNRLKEDDAEFKPRKRGRWAQIVQLSIPADNQSEQEHLQQAKSEVLV